MAKKVKLLLTVTSVAEVECPDDATPEQVMQLEQRYLNCGDIDVLDYVGGGSGFTATFSLVGAES